MKKLISKLKEVPDLDSRHPWQSPVSGNDSQNTANPSASPSHSHLHGLIGKKFSVGRFLVTVEEIIAEGGFGIVLKTRSQHDQIFALKRLHVNNKRDLKVCQREITIMSSLTHKNILPLIDSQVNEHPNGVYELLLLLAFCPNNLSQLMRSRQQKGQRLPEAVVVRVLCDVAEAVARLHYCQTPVLHRDLKVENVLVDDRGNYVLCDFGSATARTIVPVEYGVARAQEEIAKYTTLAYRAPEMVSLGGQPIDCKADIWALGCLIYYLCFFSLPFGDRPLAIQSGRFSIPPASTQPPYSDRLLKLIQYMLTVDPGKRPSVYQMSVLAFSIVNKKSPVPNFDRETVPNWEDLPLPQETLATTSESRIVRQTAPSGEQQSPNSARRSRSVVANPPRAVATSVNPRDRPRALKPPIGKSDSTGLIPDVPLRSPSVGMPPSHSFSVFLPASEDSLSPIVATCDISAAVNPVISLGASVEESPYPSHLDVSEATIQKQRIGHRRMVSETSSRVTAEDQLKTATSLSALNVHGRPPATQETTTTPASLKVLDDVDADNDASFGEEFDRIRHQSGLSMNGDHIGP